MAGEFPTQMDIVCDPGQDGETHINVYTKSRVELGRLLTNPSRIPVSLYRFGDFAGMEAFWYWLSTGCRFHDLRVAQGLKAKSIAKERQYKSTYIPGFEGLIKYATTLKVMGDDGLREMFFASSLPFLHYYAYGEYPEVAVRPANSSLWTVRHLTEMRALGEEGVKAWLIEQEPAFKEAVDRVCEMVRPTAKSA